MKINRIRLFFDKYIRLKKAIYILILVFMFLYVFSLPAFSSILGRNYITYVIMLILAAVTMFYYFVFSMIKFDKRLLLSLVFPIWSVVGTVSYSKEIRGCLTLFLLCASLFVFYFSMQCIDNNKLLIALIICSLFTFSLYFLIHYRNDIITTITTGKRLGGDFTNSNELGSYMSLGVGVSAFFMTIKWKRIKYLALIPLLTFLFCGYLTGSRTFILSSILYIIISLFILFKNKKIYFFISLIILIGLFVLLINLPFASFLKNQFLKAIKTIFGIGSSDIKTDTSTIMRWVWQDYAFYLGTKNPIIGYGFNGFSIFSGVNAYSHGNAAEIFCNFGIVGVLSFYIHYLLTFVLMFFSKKEEKYLVMLFFISSILNMFLSVSYYHKDTYIIFALLYYLTNDFELKKHPMQSYYLVEC